MWTEVPPEQAKVPACSFFSVSFPTSSSLFLPGLYFFRINIIPVQKLLAGISFHMMLFRFSDQETDGVEGRALLQQNFDGGHQGKRKDQPGQSKQHAAQQ